MEVIWWDGESKKCVKSCLYIKYKGVEMWFYGMEILENMFVYIFYKQN